MSESTPAPLTDEQIDELTETVRADFVASAADEDEIRADHETFDRWYAAVVARAKREERGAIAAQTIYVVQEWVDADGIHDGWNTVYCSFTNSRVDAEAALEYLLKNHRDTEFRLVTATRSDWKEATDE